MLFWLSYSFGNVESSVSLMFQLYGFYYLSASFFSEYLFPEY
jgi:hypothetical protein